MLTALAVFAVFASPAAAGPPTHLRTPALDLTGAASDPGSTHPAQPFSHACGAAADSKGDLYVASAANGAIDVFNPSHEYLTTIANANEPCGLAVDSKGQLYVSEKATGKVVRYKPNAYPFSGIPTYGAPSTIDASGNAKGISVDRFDDRLYVAEGNRVSTYDSTGTLKIDEIQRVLVFEATGGEFKLTFKGQETGFIKWDAKHLAVQEALEALATIGKGNVSVTQGPSAGNERDHLITFKGVLSGTDVELLKGDPSGLTGGTSKLIVEDQCTGCVQGFSGHIGEGSLTNATGVAAYTYKRGSATADRYVFAADDTATDVVKAFGGADIRALKLRRTIKGPNAGEDFGFGSTGAYLAVDPGNRNATDKCTSIAEQACTAGHLLVYDDAHEAVDEFEASGEFLDQFTDPVLADAEPTAMAVERSGGPHDGMTYVSAGAGPGAKVLAFGPAAAPSRALSKSLSHVLANAQAVITDSYGDVYVAAEKTIYVYDPAGKEIKVGPEGKGFEDPESPLLDLVIDSTGKVYVLENKEKITYYTPSAYPPVDGTTYSRHQPPIVTKDDFPAGSNTLEAIAINPGPASGKDHLFVTSLTTTREYDSAASGSKLLDSGFAQKFASGSETLGNRQSIGVYGANGNVYFGANPGRISIVDPTGKEVLASITGAGCPAGQLSANSNIAVDQSNGHVLTFDPGEAAREYDASGACVAEFGGSTSSTRPYRITIDNACALHEPPLTETTTPTCSEFDPASGNAYVAFDDAAPGTFDLTAFGPLTYGDAPLAATGIASGVGDGNAILNGTVTPRSFDVTECRFDYLLDTLYRDNLKQATPPFTGAISQACAEGLAAIGKGNSAVSVHADLTGLDPEGRYRFHLVARNKYGESIGDPWLFGPPLVIPRPAAPILYHEATLRAEVDPSGLASEYHFEFLADAEFQESGFSSAQSTPLAKLAPGDGPVAVQASLTGLAEGTTYRFRVLAGNEAKEVSGPDQVLTTLARRPAEDCPNVSFRTGLSANLPDCRAYELVTPAETNGLSPEAAPINSTGAADAGFNNWLAAPRGTGAGENLVYFTNGTLPGFEGNGILDGYRALRGAGEHPAKGWGNEVVSPSYRQSVPSFQHPLSQQSVAADQLYSFWKIDPVEETITDTLPSGIYLQTPNDAAGSLCNPRLQQDRFELVGCGSLGTDPNATGKFVSAGGADVIFGSKEHLEPEAAPEGTEALYDRAAGSSSAGVVSMKPEGSPFGAGENASYVASSEDGSAVAFKVAGVLYLHREGQSIEIAAAPNTFAGVSEDGRRVFYAATSNGETPATVLVCDAQAGPCGGPGAHAPIPIASNSTFVNISSDGSKAFFTSKEALTGSEENEAGEVAEAGERNLYTWDAEAETAHFIAGLDPQDFESFESSTQVHLGRWTTAINPGPISGRTQSPTRSIPGGEVFVFQSHAQLTPYDNEGKGEIYRYDQGAPSGERLLCVSCDPSGAPASADAMLADIKKGIDARTMIANVTDTGTGVFFQSRDRLLPEDANGVADAYEWKAKGAEGCERDGGCLALISSGQGDTPSFLYGMSADGDDVFLRTKEKLVSADVAGSPSIYDARRDGGIPGPQISAPCQGDACQGQGSTPPALGTPVSTGSREDSVEPRPAPCPKGKRRVKGRCVRPHKKHHRKRSHHKASHNREAQR